MQKSRRADEKTAGEGGGGERVAREKKERKICVMMTAYENRIFKKLR